MQDIGVLWWKSECKNLIRMSTRQNGKEIWWPEEKNWVVVVVFFFFKIRKIVTCLCTDKNSLEGQI